MLVGRDECPTMFEAEYELLVNTLLEQKRNQRRFGGRNRNAQVSFAQRNVKNKNIVAGTV